MTDDGDVQPKVQPGASDDRCRPARSATQSDGLRDPLANMDLKDPLVTPTAHPLQFQLAHFKPRNPSTISSGGLSAVHTMAQGIDKETEAAHKLVVDKLKAASDGTKLDIDDFSSSGDRFADWVRTLRENSPRMAATTGYMIEDIVSAKFKGKTGYDTQVSTGGARPDFVFKSQDNKIGVLDITSERQLGHILDKNFSLGSFDYGVESLYPTVNFSNIKGTSLTVSDSSQQAITQQSVNRANAKMATYLNNLRNSMDLLVMTGRDVYAPTLLEAAAVCANALKSRRNTDKWSDILKVLEVQLPKIGGGHTLPSRLIPQMQGRYGVSGNPPWTA